MKIIMDNMSDNEIRVLGSPAKPVANDHAADSDASIAEAKQIDSDASIVEAKRTATDASIVMAEGVRPAASMEQPKASASARRPRPRALVWACVLLAVVIVAVAAAWLTFRSRATLLQAPAANVLLADTLSVETLKDSDKAGPSYTVVSDTTINDIPLRIFTPVGARMELFVGHHPEQGNGVILAAQAANLRGDDGTPAGAFVYRGELLAKGHSKYGFCAIVDSTVSIGRQIETPLFERAIERNGSFFRQYSIVSHGKLMPIPPKGKSLRRALCLRDDELLVVESVTAESYHDFSQALEDFGVSEALALVGGRAFVMWREESGVLHQEGEASGESYPLENYIVWRTY